MSLARHISQRFRQSGGAWLTVSLLFIVLVPSVGLWWFMENAVQNEQFAVRQRLVAAYRMQLVLLRDAFEKNGQTSAAELDSRLEKISGQQLFAELIRSGSADSAAVFGSEGKIEYPTGVAQTAPVAPNENWSGAEKSERVDKRKAASAYAMIAAYARGEAEQARALQAEARCWFQAGDAEAALAVVETARSDPRLQQARDQQERLLIPNTELMAIEFTASKGGRSRDGLIEDLRRRVLDYRAPMPAPQRRFLLSELAKYVADPEVAAFRDAEENAAQFFASGGAQAEDATLRPAALPNYWQTASASGRVILLHRGDRMDARLRQRFRGVIWPPDLRLEIVPPGRDTSDSLASAPAGDLLPGWRLAISLNDARLMTAVQKRTKSYFWAASVTVLVAGLLGLLAWGLVRRQIALTQLRNDLVANVSHELKTPLASTRLLAETLLNTEKLDERVTREYLGMIVNENVRLGRLITNFLTFSRIERNRYSFEFRLTPPAEIADEAAASVRDRFRHSTGEFSMNISPALPEIAADRDALVTALVNLLDNAWKYSGETKKISLAVTAAGANVRFEVRDQGIGIRRADRARLFRRFEQGRSPAPSNVAGFGLGLSIVQFIVLAHRGKIELETEEGQGSTFSVLIPAAE